MLATLHPRFSHTPLLLSSSLLLFMKHFFKLQEELMFLLLQTLQFLPHLLNLKHGTATSQNILLATEGAFWGLNMRHLLEQYFWLPAIHERSLKTCKQYSQKKWSVFTLTEQLHFYWHFYGHSFQSMKIIT